MEASKYFLYHILLSYREMESLINELPSFIIYNVSQVTGGGEISKDVFLAAYEKYVQALKRGEVEIDAPCFSSAWSMDATAVRYQAISPNKGLYKAICPVIQLRANFYAISQGEVRPMSFGKGSVPWGLQFGFPLLYRDVETQEIKETLKCGAGNVPLFQELKNWVRTHTRPVKMLVQGQEVMTTLRKGVGYEI